MLPLNNLISGRLIKRYKRFLMDVRLDNGKIITAHCPNSGSMLGVSDANIPILLSYNNDIKRKYHYTAEMVFADNTWIGINTQNPNKLIKQALLHNKIAAITGYSDVIAEYKIGDSRLDFYLPDWGFVEVKNAHLKRHDNTLEFPDSITARGAKHLHQLITLTKKGHKTAMLYLGQRHDVTQFMIADDLDPAYMMAFNQLH